MEERRGGKRMTIGEVRRVNLPAFTVIGKEGKGLAQDGSSWVPPLWEIVNEKSLKWQKRWQQNRQAFIYGA